MTTAHEREALVCASKRLFRTRFQAEQFAAAIRFHKDHPDDVEPYPCGCGDHWHLRSVEKRLAKGHERGGKA